MIYARRAASDEIIPVCYQFERPALLLIRDRAGRSNLVGFGVGSTITVLEPAQVYLVATHERLNEIPMPGGAAVVMYEADPVVQRLGWHPAVVGSFDLSLVNRPADRVAFTKAL